MYDTIFWNTVVGNDIILKYCKFGNFRENFIFANRVIRHICDVKHSLYGKIYLYQ